MLIPTTGQSGSRLIMHDLLNHGYLLSPNATIGTYDDSAMLFDGAGIDYVRSLPVDVALKLRDISLLKDLLDMDIIGHYRHPASWMSSIRSKRKEDVRGYQFYTDFNKELIRCHKLTGFPLVEHGPSYIFDFGRALEYYGVHFVASRYDGSRMCKPAAGDVPDHAMAVYEELCELRSI